MTKAREDPPESVRPACVAFASGRRLRPGEYGSVCSVRVGAAGRGRNAESFFQHWKRGERWVEHGYAVESWSFLSQLISDLECERIKKKNEHEYVDNSAFLNIETSVKNKLSR